MAEIQTPEGGAQPLGLGAPCPALVAVLQGQAALQDVCLRAAPQAKHARSHHLFWPRILTNELPIRTASVSFPSNAQVLIPLAHHGPSHLLLALEGLLRRLCAQLAA